MDDSRSIIPGRPAGPITQSTSPSSPIPVTARRPEPPPYEVAPQQTAPPQSTTHVIYINTPPAVPQPAPPPVQQQPNVTNQYTTHHHSYRTPRMLGHSGLGMASLALGIIACVICWIPVLGLVAVPIGAIGAVLGILGVLVSSLFKRSSAGLPFAGVFVCCLAAGISIASTNSLPYWRQQLGKFVPIVAPAKSSGPVQAPPPLPDLSKGIPNVFDSQPAKVNPTPAAPAAPQPTKNAPAVKQPIPAPVDPALTAAMQKLTTAEQAAAAKFKQSQAYTDAMQSVSDAKTKVDQLRQSSPGSFDLKDASQQWMNAQNAASALVDQAVANDADVVAARAALAGMKK